MKTIKFLLIPVAGLILTLESPAQEFQKTFGSGQGGYNNKWDYATSVKQTSDGGYIVAGYSDGSGLGLDDVYLIRFNSNGDTVWTKVYGGTNKDYGRSVVQTSDGGFAVCGETQSYGVFKNDVFLFKTDSNGTLLWAKTYGGSDEDYGYSMQQTSDGGFIITGETKSFGQAGGYSDVYVIKTDGSGNVTWTKTYGGSYDDIGYSVQQTTDGGYIIAGEEGSFQYGVLLLKLNSSGDSAWVKSIRGNYAGYYGRSVVQTFDGGYAITGHTTVSGYGSYDIFLMKTTATGSPVFTKAFGSSSLDEGRAVKQTSDSGFIFTGYTYAGSTYSQLHTFKTNSSGVLQWDKVYRGEYGNEGNDIIQTSDGGYAMAGYIYYKFGNTLAEVYQGYDAYLVKTDASGNSPGCVSTASGLMSGYLTWTAYNCPLISGSGVTQNSASMNSKYSKTNPHDAAVKVNFNVTDILCDGVCIGSITANTCDSTGFYCSGTAAYAYLWSNGQSNSSATGLCEGTYTLSITDYYGCKGEGNAVVSTYVLPREICLITVDTTSTKNVIVWEKPSATGIDSFFIYREIASVFTKIGSVSYNDLSEFTDNTSGVNPNITSYRYKISVHDTCGYESVLSSYHKTIHLQISPNVPTGVNLDWDDYSGFSFAQYRVLRDDFATGNWQVKDSVSAGITSYTDPNTPDSSTRYIVEVVHPNVNGCVVTAKIKTYNSSKSNTASMEVNSGIDDIIPGAGRIVIFPNPGNGKFNVEIREIPPMTIGAIGREIRVYNALGGIIFRSPVDKKLLPVNISDYPAGIYNVQVVSEKGYVSKKIIIF
ncbi:MAG: T9SS type A sorting domain-containing protein [Bacteroidetes bacterium]|nr:T9SS type A sorting domain-containing protein [Bacteroidota bacterium]